MLLINYELFKTHNGTKIIILHQNSTWIYVAYWEIRTIFMIGNSKKI
jgi:hypothetical protein